MTSSHERRYDLDWLRILAVLLLVPFHVALIFVLDPNSIMYIKDVVNSPVLDEAAGFVHMWHMPLFFAISGAATWLALGFRSAGQYLRERFLRLLVPFLFGVLTFIPLTTYIRHIGSPGATTLWDHYRGFFRLDPSQLDGFNGTFTPAHLWFILFLFVFSLAGLPLFLALRSEIGKRLIDALAKVSRFPGVLFLWAIPLALAASLDLLGDKNPLYYFLVFCYGYLLASDARFQKSIDKLTWIALAYGLFEAFFRVLVPQWRYAEWSPQWIALGLMYQLGRWSLTLAILGLGHRFLNRANRLLHYAGEAAMPFYLLHLTFSTLAGFFVIQLDAPVAVKYPLIVLLATGLTLAAYELMVRRWNLMRWLFGMRPVKKDVPIPVHEHSNDIKEEDMKYILFHILILFVLFASSCAPAVLTEQPGQATTPTVESAPTVPVPTEVFKAMNLDEIPAPSLENNLVGEPAKREIFVYLPPSYGDPDKRFPVVYYLPGYGDRSMLGFNLPDSMDELVQSGKVNEMIVVVASGTSKMGGSFYVNSPVTGNWEDYIVQDVVGYMDSHYRTLAQAESRGITGHSMGGFGALNIAMHHPDVFSAVYSMSPGLFDENGLAESQMFESESLIKRFVKFEGELAGVPLEEAEKRMFSSPQEFALSYGYAFAPNPDRHPPYFDYPFTEVDGQMARDDAAWAKWESGFGGIADEAKQYKDNFLKLKGIVVEYGRYDEYGWIPKGCDYFGEQLTAEGIPVKVENYNGSHESVLGARIRDFMFPFFSTTLEFE